MVRCLGMRTFMRRSLIPTRSTGKFLIKAVLTAKPHGSGLQFGISPSRRMCILHLLPFVSLHLQAWFRWVQRCQICSTASLGDKYCSPLRSRGAGVVQQCPDIPGSRDQFLLLFLLILDLHGMSPPTSVSWPDFWGQAFGWGTFSSPIPSVSVGSAVLKTLPSYPGCRRTFLLPSVQEKSDLRTRGLRAGLWLQRSVIISTCCFATHP